MKQNIPCYMVTTVAWNVCLLLAHMLKDTYATHQLHCQWHAGSCCAKHICALFQAPHTLTSFLDCQLYSTLFYLHSDTRLWVIFSEVSRICLHTDEFRCVFYTMWPARQNSIKPYVSLFTLNTYTRGYYRKLTLKCRRASFRMPSATINTKPVLGR